MQQLYKIIFLLALVTFGCKTNEGSNKKPVIVRLPPRTGVVATADSTKDRSYQYDLKKPYHSWDLGTGLKEVSGNTWVDKDHLILIEDLHPELYLLKVDNRNATVEKEIPFAKTEKEKFDIEDVTMVDNVVYAIWSHGVLFRINNWNSANPEVERIPTSLSKDNNTEGVCYDPVTKSLLIACKDDAGIPDEKKSAKAVYQFNMQSKQLEPKPFLVIHKKDFEKLAGEKLQFNPSAIAVHPVTHNVYLLSTRDNKCMAVYNRDGKLISFQKIDESMMRQPEGICFSPDGTLYISTEGPKNGQGKLFEFDPK